MAAKRDMQLAIELLAYYLLRETPNFHYETLPNGKLYEWDKIILKALSNARLDILNDEQANARPHESAQTHDPLHTEITEPVATLEDPGGEDFRTFRGSDGP